MVQQWGIAHHTSSPCHSQANGAAKAAVQTAKTDYYANAKQPVKIHIWAYWMWEILHNKKWVQALLRFFLGEEQTA